YEVNDLGFQTRVDRISAAAFLGHRWTKPGNIFRVSTLSAFFGPSWNYGGGNIQKSFSGGAFAQGPNFWRGNPTGRRTLRATATATYAARYVFADLRQRSIDVTLRLNVTMSPSLSFQLYAQPFTFAGDYSGFKELRASHTFDFNVYGRDNGSTITVTATDPQG